MERIINRLSEEFDLPRAEAEKILEKAVAGGEISPSFSAGDWYERRFLPNTVWIDQDNYARMCIDALKILKTTAPTDYGSSRQRDFGQIWADMTRGYLGELAVTMFLRKKAGIEASLGHEPGGMAEYLPMDIHEIMLPGEKVSRKPKLKIGVKATKWNGIWMDIPGDQFDHSDIHILVKVGTGRDHLFAFFKSISVFRDKILKCGESIGSLTAKESEDLFDSLPSFNSVPAYICGHARKARSYPSLSYTGKKGRKNFEITEWNGPILPGDLNKIKLNESVTGKIKFLGIGEFSHDKGYLFNTGNLLWQDDEWQNVFGSL